MSTPDENTAAIQAAHDIGATVIEETTVATLHGIRVPVACYVVVDGVPQIDILAPEPRYEAKEGDIFPIGDVRYRVHSLGNADNSTTGWVALVLADAVVEERGKAV